MNKELESFVKDYLANNVGRFKANELYDEIKKKFPNLSYTEFTIVIIDLLIGGDLSIYTRIREWFEKSKKEHREGIKCGFCALDKYFDALENEEKEDLETARKDIEEANEIMKRDADNGDSFVKEVFGHLIDSQYQKLHK